MSAGTSGSGVADRLRELEERAALLARLLRRALAIVPEPAGFTEHARAVLQFRQSAREALGDEPAAPFKPREVTRRRVDRADAARPGACRVCGCSNPGARKLDPSGACEDARACLGRCRAREEAREAVREQERLDDLHELEEERRRA